MKEACIVYGNTVDYARELDLKLRGMEMNERLGLYVNKDIALCMKELGVAYKHSGEPATQMKYLQQAVNIYGRLWIGFLLS